MPKNPTLKQLQDIAMTYNLHLSEEDLQFFHTSMETTLLPSYNRLEQLNEPALLVKYPRTGSYRPTGEENLLNAWYQKCSIKGTESGPLAGKRIAIKDNICVAGVPMMNGSAVLEGYIPEFDATIITRILDAGAEVVGKTVCEHLCLSGGSHTSDTGPVRNPHNQEHSTGGSSSGSAALVVAGECDMALGSDQGGSIRMPAGWSGAYGLKPTYGLVPYTGIFPLELTLDHVGPIAATTTDVALLLNTIAGEDGLDPRQKQVKTENYLDALVGETKALRIGIVKEGFGWSGLSEPDVDEMVEAAAYRFIKSGSTISTISIPMHVEGIHIMLPIATEGSFMTVTLGNSMGTNWKGHYSTSMLDAFARGRMTRADDLSDMNKLYILTAQYMRASYHGRYYAKAQNLARVLTKAYDDALKSVDLLVMPTLPMKATKIPGRDASREEKLLRAGDMMVNTAPFNVTGHPAMAVPCGMSEGLPVSMMLIGRRGEDATVLRAAHAFEQMSGYRVRPQNLATFTL